MATIFNNVDRVAGDPLSSVLVTIVLLWDTSESPMAKIEDEDTIVRGTYGTSTDLDGHWEVDLVPNDEITPVDSVYKITERLSTNNDSITYYISVPDSATPTSWIGDIILSQEELPSWI
jgi:hypothetical protein